MKANKTAILILTLLSTATTACSSISSMEDTLVGEWQSSKPKSVHLKITKRAASDGDYYEWFSYTTDGQTHTSYWRIRKSDRGTFLVLADASFWGGFERRTGGGSMTESTDKIIELTSDRFVVEWAYRGNPGDGVKDVYEFQRVKQVVAQGASPEASASQRVPMAECTTPCSLNVGWSTTISTGGRQVWAKFLGKKERFLLSGREDGPPIPRDKFNPGMAEFTSPDSTPVHVQLFPATSR